MSYYAKKERCMAAMKALLTAETVNRPSGIQIVTMWERVRNLKSRRIEVGVSRASIETHADAVTKGRGLIDLYVRAITSWSGDTEATHKELCSFVEAHVERSDLADTLTTYATHYKCIRAIPGDSTDELMNEDGIISVVSEYNVQLYCILEAT